MAMGLCFYSKKPTKEEISNLEHLNTTVTNLILSYESIFDEEDDVSLLKHLLNVK
jgi:hypothetical protein